MIYLFLSYQRKKEKRDAPLPSTIQPTTCVHISLSLPLSLSRSFFLARAWLSFTSRRPPPARDFIWFVDRSIHISSFSLRIQCSVSFEKIFFHLIRFTSSVFSKNPIRRPEELWMAHITPAKPPMMPLVIIAGLSTGSKPHAEHKIETTHTTSTTNAVAGLYSTASTRGTSRIIRVLVGTYYHKFGDRIVRVSS